jgi:hypothetical protein
MPVLVVQLLRATPFEVGVVNAAQFVPYALLGLIAGVYTDRWRRVPSTLPDVAAANRAVLSRMQGRSWCGRLICMFALRDGNGAGRGADVG